MKAIVESNGALIEGTDGPVTARGVPLREAEWLEIEHMARQAGNASPTSLLSVLVRYGLEDYRAGRVSFKMKMRRNRKMQFTKAVRED